MKRAFVFIFIASVSAACSSVFYYPNADVYVEAEKLSPRPADVAIDGEDGVRLHAWFFKPAGVARGLITFTLSPVAQSQSVAEDPAAVTSRRP